MFTSVSELMVVAVPQVMVAAEVVNGARQDANKASTAAINSRAPVLALNMNLPATDAGWLMHKLTWQDTSGELGFINLIDFD